MKPTLYIESSVVSYLTARPVRDVLVLAHQDITRVWWEERLPLFQAFISPVVLAEAREGDPVAAATRLQKVEHFPVLQTTDAIEHLAAEYMARLPLPPRAIRDAAHLAFACGHKVDYLVTWNCAHIANGEIRRRLRLINSSFGMETPTICTPEELMGEEEK